MATIRMVLAMTTISDWKVQKLDVKIAFLPCDLDEVYMEELPCFVMQGMDEVEESTFWLKVGSVYT